MPERKAQPTDGPLAHIREHAELIEADIRLLRRLLPPDGRVLDLGAGRGSFVAAAQRRGVRAVALDLEPAAAAIWRRAGVPGLIGDGNATPFADGCFDAVRMKEIIEHLEAPLALVREARRLLRPGGIVIAHVPSPYSQLYPAGNFWDDYTHVRPFSRAGLQRLFADAGLDVTRIEAYTSGRNAVERAVGLLLARVLPHTYRVIGRRPPGEPGR